MTLKHFTAFAACIALAAGCISDRGPAYKNPDLSAGERTEDLLARMTVDEKLGQLLCPLGWPMYYKTVVDGRATAGISDEFRNRQRTARGNALGHFPR